MSSFTGYITYLDYTAGSEKGDTHQGDLLNGAFKLGKAQPNYTSSKVESTEVAMPATVNEGTEEDPVNVKYLALKWSPVLAGSLLMKSGNYYYFDVNGTVYETTTKPSTTTVMNADGTMSTTTTGDTSAPVGTINYGKVRANPYNNTSVNGVNYQPPVGYAYSNATAEAVIRFTTLTNLTEDTFDFVNYIFNNEYVPQNDIRYCKCN